jgi:hypothetical protein
MDRFILTFHNNTLFVLDPEEGNIIGVLSLQCSISALATSGGHIFLMCQATNSRKIIKLSIHPSLVKLRSTQFLNAGRFAGNLSAASSRAGSREALDQIHIDKDSKSEGRISPRPPNLAGKQNEERIPTEEGEMAAKIEEKLSLKESDGVKDISDVKVIKSDSPMVEGRSEDVEKDGVTGKEMTKDCGVPVEETAALVERLEENEKLQSGGILEEESLEAKWLTGTDASQTESERAAAKTTPSDESRVAEQPENTRVVDTTTVDSVVHASVDNSNNLPKADGKPATKKELESEKESSSIPEQSKGGKSIIPTLALVQGISHVKADLKEITGVLKLGKLTEFISQATHHSPTLQRKSEQHSTYFASSDTVRLSTDTSSSANQEVRAVPTTVAPPTTIALPTVDPEEQRRRLRMAEMVERDRDDENIVVATKSQSKARKTRKRRTKKSSKHSSAASEWLSVTVCNLESFYVRIKQPTHVTSYLLHCHTCTYTCTCMTV